MGEIRTSDETYYQAWLPWVQKVGEIIAANQITEGGVRENIHPPSDQRPCPRPGLVLLPPSLPPACVLMMPSPCPPRSP